MNQNLFLLILFLFSLGSCANKDAHIERNLTFKTQDQIDAFAKNFPACTSIKGTIIIGGERNESIENLMAFKKIQKIEGHFKIDNNRSLHSLEGLDNLDTINGTFEILRNNKLKSLTGLDNLTYIRDEFFIARETNCTDLKGLEKLAHVGGLKITGTELRSLSGIHNLKSITRGLVCLQNPMLVNIDALNNVEKIEYLQLHYNPRLKNCNIKSFCDLEKKDPVSAYVEHNTRECKLCK